MLFLALALTVQANRLPLPLRERVGEVSARLSWMPPSGENRFYPGNRAPLTPSAFRKLPIGAIKPTGWVRTQLQLEADGFVGHLTEISHWLKKENNAWLSPEGLGENGWEEVPYWLKGFGDLGYVLDNPRIKAESRTWIEAVLKSQRSDGWFGPRANLLANKGKPDVWPNMVMLFTLQSYYEFHPDPRVLKFMDAYFKWEMNLPEENFLLSYWEKHRGGDNLSSVFWLYNRTGEHWLLDLARKIHRRTANWVDGVPDYHGVNFAQAFREPATYSQLSKDPEHVEATEIDFQTMRHQYGEVPGGMYGADEIARKGFSDPRQCAETCAMVEMMGSDEMLLAQTGDAKWAERCEDVTFNSLPASMTSDEKALHYLTAPNMPLADAQSKNPGIMNSGPMLLFDPNDHRCCQHNVSQGWPYYAEHLWLATGGNGLAAVLYAPCEVKALVGIGEEFRIREMTNYPFEETVRFALSREIKSLLVHPLYKPLVFKHLIRQNDPARRFPLSFRIPRWCTNPRLTLNGKSLKFESRGDYAILNRIWNDGDQIVLQLPMKTRLRTWAANNTSVSVERGPLTYSLAIQENLQRKGGTDAWPAFEDKPASPWNYGIVPDLTTMKFVQGRSGAQPFDPAECPVAIEAKGRRIPEWQLDSHGLVNVLQPSPVFSGQPLETLRLIPMGAARLRISAFPTVSTSPSAHHWQSPPKPKTPIPATSSHTFENDTTSALSDGLMPKDSGDETIPRFTWWPRKGSTEWVEYDFPATRTFSHCDVYWFDDRENGGGCRVPESWQLQVLVNGAWHPTAIGKGVLRNAVNALEFFPETANKFRLQVKLQPGFSGGILEWTLR